jgi:hypothetical protein
MPMTLRLSDADAGALKVRAQIEGVSMQVVVQHAIREYIEQHSRADLIDEVLNTELPRYAEALARLAE